MKKLNAKGFAHQVAIMAIVVVVAIGGIGSYIYLRSSSAASAKDLCGKGYTYMTSKTVYDKNDKAGPAKLYLYEDELHVCGVLMSTGSAYGVAKPMKVDGYSYKDQKKVSNSGKFKYWAGPIRITTCTKTRCYRGIISATMDYKGKHYYAERAWQ